MIALAALLLAAPAAAPLPKLEGRTILAGCRQGECRWMKVARLSTDGRYPQGELRRMRVRIGTSTHLDGRFPTAPAGARIAWEPAEQDVYAFCSRVRPAYAFAGEGGKLIVHYLDPFDLAGYQYSSAALYMRICHDRTRVPDEKGLRALGYRPKTRNGQIEGAGVEALTRF